MRTPTSTGERWILFDGICGRRLVRGIILGIACGIILGIACGIILGIACGDGQLVVDRRHSLDPVEGFFSP